MKIFLLSALVICSLMVFQAKAQREPQFTNYMFNKLTYNPAYAGSQENICATLLYHNQWSNFHSDLGDGSTNPVTQTFTIHTPIDVSPKFDLGVGLHFLNDNLGFEHTFEAAADVAYRKRLSFANVAAGLSLGYIQTDLKGQWIARDPGDARLPGTVSDKAPDIGFGVYLNNPDWYAGVSALHLTEPKLTWASGGNSVIPRAYYLIAGYNYLVTNTKFEIQPGTLIQTDFAKTQYNIHALVMYDQFVWAGLNYHAQDALSLLVGLKLKLGLKIDFSYDLTTSDARPFGGKVEVLLNYCFRLNIGEKYPTFHRTSRFL